MRKLALFSAIAAFLLPIAAYADNAEGLIVGIDSATNTMQLTDGNTYKLPGEFDYTVIHEGMKVLVFYDLDGANRYVTDIEPASTGNNGIGDGNDAIEDYPDN